MGGRRCCNSQTFEWEKIMTKFKFAAILAAGAAFALSPAYAQLPFQPKHADEGIQLLNIQAGSGADQFGFKSGDVIVEQDGKPINGHSAVGYIMNIKKGDKAVFKVKRGDQYIELTSAK